jgi:hypothetical protein
VVGEEELLADRGGDTVFSGDPEARVGQEAWNEVLMEWIEEGTASPLCSNGVRRGRESTVADMTIN